MDCRAHNAAINIAELMIKVMRLDFTFYKILDQDNQWFSRDLPRAGANLLSSPIINYSAIFANA